MADSMVKDEVTERTRLATKLIKRQTEISYQLPEQGIFNIFFEGTIGEGKTTLCDNFRKLLEEDNTVHVIQCHEEVDSYLLEKFYENPTAMEVILQNSMIVSRIKARIQATERAVNIRKTSDRPIYILNDTGFLTNETFITANFMSGHIGAETFANLMNILHSIESSLSPSILSPTHVILLQSDVQNCMRNIKNRGRESEQNIPNKYLETLMDWYMQVYNVKLRDYPDVQFMSYDTKCNFLTASNLSHMINERKYDFLNHLDKKQRL